MAKPSVVRARPEAAGVKAPILYLLVFVSGATVMGVEMTASRLIAPYFGSSLYVWTNLIGVVLAFLSLGYWLGGILADRWPRMSLLFAITLAAGLFIGAIPFIAKPVMEMSFKPFGEFTSKQFFGSLLATMGILAVPNLLLGCVLPFAIRLRLRAVEEGGRTAGVLYGLSTVGSIVGTYVPVMLAIPYLGVRTTFIFFSAALISVSALGLGFAFLFFLAVPGLLLFMVRGPIRPPRYQGQKLLAEIETRYNYLQVVEDEGFLKLVSGAGLLVQSKYRPGRLLTGSYWDYFLLAPQWSPRWGEAGYPGEALILGFGSGVNVRQFHFVYPGLAVDAVEVDPAMKRIALEWFDLRPEYWRNLFIADGRLFLTASDGEWDLILVDVYQDAYVPFQMVTVEFFELIRSKLKPGGVMSMNMAWNVEGLPELAFSIVATLEAVFGQVYLLQVPGWSNMVIMAGDGLVGPEQWNANLSAWRPPLEVLDLVSLRRPIPRGTGIIGGPAEHDPFTDDMAPVEVLTDRIFFTYYVGAGNRK